MFKYIATILIFLFGTAHAEYSDQTESRYSFTTNEYLVVFDEYRPPLPVPPPPKEFEVMIDKSDYRMTVIEHDQPVAYHKVIVGRTGKETPNLDTLFFEVVINPYWDVPFRLLPDFVALMKSMRDPVTYMNNKGFVVFKDGNEIDTASIDWKNLPNTGPYGFAISQNPGPENYIGQFLFKLEDSGDIQLHDTPDKKLFEKKNREFSAGCIRVDRAQELAARILDKDPKEIAELVEAGEPIVFSVYNPVRVTIVD